MPIIIGGKVIDPSQIAQEKPPVQQQTIQRAVDTSNEFSTPPKRVVFEKKKTPKITDGNTLIVNGKAKTIGRKSQYLLDMMIIDDE